MEHPVILMIETSTEWCSVAVSEGETIVARRLTQTGRQHASLLAPFVDEVLKEAGLKASDCDAVAVSEGPGSYTGLRVGVSTAKGLCFGAGIPLLAVGTLKVLAMQGAGKADFIVPMIDARRMEVYCAIFDGNGAEISDTEARILDESSFSDLLEKGRVLFRGDGAAKFSEVCHHPNALFDTTSPLADGMLLPALESYKKKEFEDIAYFEPFYLKEFVAGISKKSVL
ncbi:MAG: tRNA (adenosine(37)-N6)-threonylcarbamoyltransferase complex dimerization subunit type 1 TsaB [Bacteroidales bacterium]|nr:tRNA (adenosine(37)-N6)-threonylcarbamoyltransferase complex dimerization subunit type 1 TsaB [Bacteroidales bacterium]